jgi:hypothetical protein
VSEFSPGAVASHETVCRSVFSPPQFGKTAPFELDETLFEDVFTRGASTQRANPDDDEQLLHARGGEKAAADREKALAAGNVANRLYVGFVPVNVGEIRAALVADAPVAARTRVYDTGLKDNSLHADIMCDQRDCASGSKTHKLMRKQIRIALFNVANSQRLYLSPFLDETHLAGLNLGVFKAVAQGQ